ncbi:unnamed protein product [Fusarium venenatum]|uniref:Uncharacterized protein n=1 Tax=Fusarium venenatum TaxID=56646 RepID=A0A2L2T5N4_9HYPO|nr:uncharacterized protein FVRRES_01461 [Fusarium venenatum]CEI64949.1 unnamed protein product [Fusarium venenatum]
MFSATAHVGPTSNGNDEHCRFLGLAEHVRADSMVLGWIPYSFPSPALLNLTLQIFRKSIPTKSSGFCVATCDVGQTLVNAQYETHITGQKSTWMGILWDATWTDNGPEFAARS